MQIILKFVFVVLLNLITISSRLRGDESKDFDKTIVLINTVNKKKQSNKLLNCEYRNANYSESCKLERSRNAFPAGVDIDGQPLFVCRVNQFNEKIPGKFSLTINKCMVTHNKREFHFNRYQLLVKPELGSYKWIQVKRPAKKLPDNIVLGGGSNLKGFPNYICKCSVRSQNIKFISQQIGKVYWNHSISEWIATVPFSGQEVECFDYSVLIMV